MTDPQQEPGVPAADPRESGDSAVPATSPGYAPLAERPVENAPTVISSRRAASNNDFTDQLKGRKLAHFELEEAVGVGGMAAVIRARDTQLDRQVALKILPPEMAADPENIRRFEQEARSAARLDHENIARVYYCGADQGLHFIAFEFVQGRNLRALIDQRGRIPPGEAIHFVLQIATGLAHAAERGVVHRDIKPSNIIIDENGRAKLVDMGLARSLAGAPNRDLTHSGVTLGTFDYISPEQALEPRAADVRSDIYSLGCTLYHMLTGRPPVPEGTAARKLQFHQHGAPIDPRQFNPEIPDELAAILAKMMAKNPGERYQRPEFLVQHLLAVAQKLAAQENGKQVPGVLFLDSILPAPPRTNPLLVLTLGAAAVILLVGVIGLMPEAGTVNQPDENPPAVRTPGEKGPAVRSAEGRSPPIVLDNKPLSSKIRNASHLRSLAKDGVAGDFTLEPDREDRVLELSVSADEAMSDRPPGLVFRNADIQLRNTSAKRPIIRLTHDVANPYGKEWAAITLMDGRLVLRGIRFEIDARSGIQSMAVFHLMGGRLTLEHCEFVQKDPPVSEADARLTVLKVLSIPNGSAQPTVEFRNCYFAGGQDAITLDDAAGVVIEDCVFAPYESPVQIGGRASQGWETHLHVSSSSWLLRPGPVFAVNSQQRCAITLERSVFSQPDDEQAPEGARATLLQLGPRQAQDRCSLTSKDNYFHNLGTLVAQLGGDHAASQRIVDLDDFNLDMLDQMKDSGSRLSETSPWAEPNPLKALEKLQQRAFALKPMMALRPENPIPLGAREVVGEELYPVAVKPNGVKPSGAPGEQRPAAAPTVREFVVDGQANFKTVASAFGAAEGEDAFDIVLKLNGPVAVMPLEIGDKKVRIRAEKNYRPILTLNPRHVPGADGEAALFRIHDGELTLEQLEFQVDPLRQQARLQSLVAIVGAGSCRLERCAVTLNGGEGTRLGLVAVGDPTGTMMGTADKPARPGVPAIRLVDCFLRGQGDAVSLRASRPFDLEARNTLAVLAGSFIVSEGNRRDAAFNALSNVTLDHVTLCLTQNLAVLRGSPTNPTHAPLNFTNVSSCVFASLEARPLVYLDGPQSEDDLRRWLTWRGQKNVYNTTGSLLVWQPLEMTMGMERMPQRCDAERWQRLWGGDEDQPLFNRLKFSAFPAADKPLAQAVPAEFQVEPAGETTSPDLATRGADVDRLPQPSRDAGSGMEE